MAAGSGTGTCKSECSNGNEANGNGVEDGRHCKEGWSFQMSQANSSTVLVIPKQVTPVYDLCSNHVDVAKSSANMGGSVASELAKESCLCTKADEECHSQALSSTGRRLDLNAVKFSTVVDHNPFYPYKMLGQSKSTGASECGSTTGSIEDSEPLRLWKEMKQNGFLSSSHGGIPVPKQRGRQSKKRKEEEQKKRYEMAKREQVNKFIKFAAPSGLLSGLNPGIINHVRNSRQVYSIINALVHSEQLDCQNQNRDSDQLGRGSKENSDKRKELHSAHGLAANQFAQAIDTSAHDISTISQSSSEYDDTLTLKLSSSAVTVKTENASNGHMDDSSANEDMVASLSLKAATVASQWLELLEQDIKGRLAALRRSKKRVRNVIQIELPYLLSTEFSLNQENGICFELSSEARCSKKAILDTHAGRWTSLFSQMDRALNEEAKHLEHWLRQVQEMQLHCDKGLKYATADGTSLLGTSEDPRMKKPDSLERESALRAAAASIYSTCNMIMTMGNVPCF